MRILVRPFIYRHPRAWGSMYLAAGTWLVFLVLAAKIHGSGRRAEAGGLLA